MNASLLDPDGPGAKQLKQSASNKLLLQVVKLDVTSEDDQKATFKLVEKWLTERNLQLYAIVNNAGIAHSSLIEWHKSSDGDVDDFKRLLDVNFLSVVRTCRSLLPLVRKSRGRVINLTSFLSRIGIRNISYIGLTDNVLFT